MTHRMRIFIGIIFIAAMTAILGIILGYQSLKKSFPQTRGNIHLAGLKEPVSVIRDSIAVPHIFAKNSPDLYLAIGYVMAQDRLWQMELTRRTAAGRLAEIFGPAILSQDKIMRTIGIMRTAAQLQQAISPQSQKLLTAFSQGVNAYLQDNKNQLPIEFNILNYQPEPWSEIDCLASQRLMAWNMSVSWYVDLLNAMLAQHLRPEYLRYLGIDSTIIKFPDPNTGAAYAAFAGAFLEKINKLDPFFPVLDNHLSNSTWVISGSKSRSGKPVLASDLHSTLTIPCLMYQMHWLCPDEGIDASGLCYPGLPAILMGANPAIAWSSGNAFIDDVDFFIQKTSAPDSSQYWLDNQLFKFQILKEEIAVRGFKPEKIQIRICKDGPIISDLTDQKSPPVALRWTGYEMTDEFKAYFDLQRAGNLSQFATALDLVGVPGLYFVYADTGANIAARLAAQVPLRRQNNGLLALAGWDSQAKWAEFLPKHQMSVMINPPENLIISANQKNNFGVNKTYLTSYWEPAFRADRIGMLLAQKSKLGPEDFAVLQTDNYSSLARSILPFFLQVMANARYKKDDVREQVYQMLKDWDLHAGPQSIPACIFNIFFKVFLDLTFQDDLNEALFRNFLKLNASSIMAIDKLCQQPNSGWFDNCETDSVIETRDDILLATVEKGIEWLRENLGPDPGDWRWGNLHTLTFRHPFGSRKVLELPFTLGPMPGQGGLATINVGTLNFRRPFKQIVGANARMIVDLAHPDSFWSCLAPGQSGQLFNAHFKDQLPFWLSGRLHLIEKQNEILAIKYDEKLILNPVTQK